MANDQLEQAMQRRLDGVTETDPAKRARARLRATGRAYVEFAVAEPGLFNVAFCPTDADESAREEAAPYVLLGQVLDELVETGALSPDGRLGADVVCWSAVHGLSVLLLDGALRDLVRRGARRGAGEADRDGRARADGVSGLKFASA